MSAEISLEKLFEEQKKPAEPLFVITPLDDEFVRMRLWRPHEPCMCGSGFVKVPRSAILSVTKTGKTTVCCGKLFQVVAVEFSKEPMLTYKDLFAAVQRSSPTGQRSKLKPARRLVVPKIEPVIPPNPGGGGGDDDDDYPPFTGDPTTDSQKLQACVQQCIASNLQYAPKESPTLLWAWLAEVAQNCNKACMNYLTTGDPNPLAEDE